MSGGEWVSRGVGGSESGGESESEERCGSFFVTPKGVLLLAMCHASATHEDP